MERLNGKVAIVTGGAHGIGRVLSLGLADEGASVVVADVDEQAAQQLASEMTQAGKQCLALPVDVTSEESTVAMARRTLVRSARMAAFFPLTAHPSCPYDRCGLGVRPVGWIGRRAESWSR